MERKNMVRLTESQLHNIIAESVKKALNELDARTYANYARKRKEQGQYKKAEDGRQAAINAWNEKYGGISTTQDPKNSALWHTKGIRMGELYDPQEFEITYNDKTGARRFACDSYDTINGVCNVNSKWNTEANGEYKYGDASYYYDDSDDPIRAERNRVAREMATGTGTYDPKKGGWQ